MLGVAQGALDHLLQHPSAAVGLEAEDVERLVGELAANEIGQRPHLAGADPSVFVGRCVGLGLSRCRGHFPAGASFTLPPCPRNVRVGENSPN